MPNYKYQTVHVDLRSMATGGPSVRGQAVGAGIQLLHQGIIALGGWALDRRVRRELERLQPEIDKVMPSNGGVLVCVGLQEWERPDPTGHKAQMFLAIHVAGGGADMRTALMRYQSQARLVQAAPKGWVRVDRYVWVTRK